MSHANAVSRRASLALFASARRGRAPARRTDLRDERAARLSWRAMRHRLIFVLAALVIVNLALAASVAAQERPVVRVAITSDLGGLTPYGSDNGYPLMSLVYDTLTLRDVNGVPRPWLARSVVRDASGRLVTARLRRGVRWHDGRPLTAEDVAFTYRYAAARSNPRFAPQVRDIASVSAVGRYTVRFELRRASLGFLDQPLADVPILPRHLWDGLPAGRRAPPGLAVGSGPYRLVRHAQGRRYRFAANERYFRGVPVGRIEMPIIRRPQERLDALRDDKVDAIPVTVPAGIAPAIDSSDRLAEGIEYGGTMLVFNVTRPPFDALDARRAVTRALDLRSIAGAQGGAGAITPADHGLLHPRSPWASKRVLHRFDAGAARVAVADEGVGAFRILVNENDPVQAEAGRRVVSNVARAGVRARLVRRPVRAFTRALATSRSARTFDAVVLGIPKLASYDPAFLRALFGDPRTSRLNPGQYRSARFERLADRVAAAPTRAARRAAVDAELRLLASDLPAVPLFFGGTTVAYDPSAFGGWVNVRGSGVLDKRSFLNQASSAPQTVAGDDPTDRGFGGSDDGFSLVPIILVAAALMLVALGWWQLRRRS